jgi:peptide/nickel transport system substrate-binding protein
MSKNRLMALLAALAVFALVLAACQPQTEVVEVTRIVTETEVVEGEAVVVTQVVTEVEEVVVTATPVPAEEVVFAAPDPTTLVIQTIGDMDTLDPALNYETAGGGALLQIYEPLVLYNFNSPTDLIPGLATEVPSLENGGISEDGMTYTFNIREGVTFHNGATLEPSDVAYTLQRGLLQSDPNGPQWLMIEPIMGYTSGDITEEIGEGAYAGDQAALIENATPEELLAVCENVKTKVVADDAAGTVTITLAFPWGPFLSTLTQPWGSVMDQDWAIENGAWDGDCATWQNSYALGAENTPLGAITNGTGPYKLDHWTPGEEWVLTANEAYWRTEPMWEGGPSGVPQVKTVINRIVSEWGTRFAALQAGDAAWVDYAPENESQLDPLVGEFCDWQTLECTVNPDNPEGPLTLFAGLPSVSRTDIFPTWSIAPDSPYIGSGQLDGNGIPADFFSDINVRKALATCMDWDTFIAEAFLGNGVRNNGPIINDMLGWNPDGPLYEYDPEACAGYLAEAWDGQLPETGFRFQIAYNAGNQTRQTIAQILQSEIGAVSEEGLYNIEVVSLPWPTFLRSFRAQQLPMSISGWVEDIHDPHNWVQPYTYGTFGGRQGLPEDVIAKYEELASAAARETDPAKREEMYFEIGQLFHDDAISIIGAQRTGKQYQQRWVDGYFYRVGQFEPMYYNISLDGQ